MKPIMKRIGSLLLSVCMVLTLLPGTAFADEEPTAALSRAIEAYNGTLTGHTLSATVDTNPNVLIVTSPNGEVTANGTLEIEIPEGATVKWKAEIASTEKMPIIKITGSKYLSTGSKGIFEVCEGGSITGEGIQSAAECTIRISDGGTVKATLPYDTSDHPGIRISGSRLEISGGTVEAASGSGFTNGISMDYTSRLIITSGTVKATGKYNIGINCYAGTVEIRGGTVEAAYTAQDGGATSTGLQSTMGTIIMTGGELKASTMLAVAATLNSSHYSNGQLMGKAQFKMTGGTVTASGKNSTGFAIYDSAELEIGGGTLSATGNGSKLIDGISSSNTPILSGGTLQGSIGKTPKDTSGSELFLVTLTNLPANKAITQLTRPAGYGIQDVNTDGNGQLYFYVPESQKGFILTCNGETYYGSRSGTENTVVMDTATSAFHTVTVNNGTGTGSYLEGETVSVSADPAPNGQVFDQWTSGDSVNFNNEKNASTTFIMPPNAVTVSATYKAAPIYTITFDANDGSGATTTLQSDSQGKLTTLPSLTRSKYRFDGWFTAASSGSEVTTSTVFTDKTTIYAHWTYTGGSGGGSGSSSSGKSTTTTTTTDKSADQSVTATTSVTATAGINGAASASVAAKTIADVIAKAQADAKAQGKTDSNINLSITLNNPASTRALDIVLSQPILSQLTAAKIQQFELNGQLLTLNFNQKAITQVQSQSSGDVTIAIHPVTVQGVRNAYDITLNSVKDGKAELISNLGKGSVTLSIPYAPAASEDTSRLYAVYVDENGKLTRIDGSSYDTKSKSMMFSTNHFSVYGIGYDSSFTDTGSHWAKESIDYVVSRGLFSGLSDGTFRPDAAITRGDFVTALGRLSSVNKEDYKKSSFTDIKADAYYLPYVEWAYKNGIIQGTGSSQFAPNRAITREEIASVLQNYTKATGYKLSTANTAASFTDDGSISSIFKQAVTTMHQAGILKGDQNNRFNPKSITTRAEVSTILQRYIPLTVDASNTTN